MGFTLRFTVPSGVTLLDAVCAPVFPSSGYTAESWSITRLVACSTELLPGKEAEREGVIG